MGKAAERRKGRREKYLAGLAEKNPERFQAEWNKRMDSWLEEVNRRAGKLVDGKGNPIPPAFEVVDTAKGVLEASGVKETAIEAHNSIDMLSSECCKEVSSRVDGRLYRLNPVLKKKGER